MRIESKKQGLWEFELEIREQAKGSEAVKDENQYTSRKPEHLLRKQHSRADTDEIPPSLRCYVCGKPEVIKARRIIMKKITNDETKYRIDFDASSHSPGHPSLSDVLEIEPNRLPEIMATLLRFRLSKIAITCERSQAFLQVILSDQDRDTL
ncbi:reverse transcriptase domain-containing protein [Nephila pilipes]|uniref:Reverse transcriptase domain-containing protein n=1 Tax=Nephila pilipes TaxID=299642 RepID=A0A8X6THF4_NEPPI|nr:reverse transcriptase domain-containing protein [Nephila pilipes]